MKRDPELEAEVLTHLREFNEDVRRDEIDAISSRISPDFVGFGSGAHERYLGPEEALAGLKRDVSQVESLERDYKWIHTVQRGSLIIFATEYEMRWTVRGDQFHSPSRLTGVLERHRGQLRDLQSHFSFPATAQSTGQSWPTPIEAIVSAVRDERPDLRSQAAPDGTITMLFTDIENSSNITERLGDTQWLDVLRAHNALVREQLSTHRCFEVKSQGDGFMIASQSARRAIRCAIAIQRELTRYDENSQESIHVRMGLHTGEVLKDADDFFGKHVILASRIAGQARGGEILVSALLRELTESGGDVNFGDTRDVELKGLSGIYRVHEVLWNRT